VAAVFFRASPRNEDSRAAEQASAQACATLGAEALSTSRDLVADLAHALSRLVDLEPRWMRSFALAFPTTWQLRRCPGATIL